VPLQAEQSNNPAHQMKRDSLAAKAAAIMLLLCVLLWGAEIVTVQVVRAAGAKKLRQPDGGGSVLPQ
jgi:hypothetical protein